MKKLTLLLLFIGAICQAQTRVYTLKVDKWAKVTDSVQSKLYRQGGDTLATKAYVRERSFDTSTIYQNLALRLKNIDTITRTKVLTRKATDSLINYALTGTVDTKGNWDASGNTLPSTSVKTGDKWTISVKGFVSPDSFFVGDVIIAKIDDPGQTVTNWNHIYASQPKSVNIVGGNSSQSGVVGYTGRTKTPGYWVGGNQTVTSASDTLCFNGVLRSTKIFKGNYEIRPFTTTDASLFSMSFSSPTLYLNWLSIRRAGAFYTGTTFPNTASRLNFCGYLYPNGLNIQDKAIIDSTGKGTFKGVISSVTNNSISSATAAIAGCDYNKGVAIYGLTNRGISGYFTNASATLSEKDTVSTVYVESYKSIYKNTILSLRLKKTTGDLTFNQYLLRGYKESTPLINIDSSGYIFNLRPTFSSVFFDSTRVIELDVNTPKIISNAWGNLWPNSVLVGFTESKDTAIVGYTGNYNMTFDFNCNVSGTASFRYYVKKRPANTTTVTTIYRKEVSNSGTTVNRAMSLNYNFSAGDRVWIELENITDGTDVTVYAGSFAITANYLNP